MRSTKTVLRNLNSKKGACEMREKSQVEDIDRSIYDIRDEEKDAYRMKEGLVQQFYQIDGLHIQLDISGTDL